MILNGDRDELGRYVREMADLCGLMDWTIHMQPGNPDNENHFASCQPVYGRKHANLWFRDGWERVEPDSLRATVVHELLHCHLNPVVHQTLNSVGELIGKSVYEASWEWMEQQLEYAVDSIADAWSQSLPLPIKEQEAVTPERIYEVREIDHGTFNGRRYVTQIPGDATNEHDDFEIHPLPADEVHG